MDELRRWLLSVLRLRRWLLAGPVMGLGLSRLCLSCCVGRWHGLVEVWLQ